MVSVPPLLRPFSGYIPTSSFGHRVAEPTRALLPADHRKATRGDTLVFRRAAGRGARAGYSKALAWLEAAERQGAVGAVGPTVLVYRQESAGHAATGLIANVSLTAYDQGVVRRHERIIDETARKMIDYVRTTRVFGNPITLAHRTDESIKSLIATCMELEPDSAFETADGSWHQLWQVPRTEAQALCRTYEDNLYVTDGHHRLAAASLVAQEEGRTDATIPAGLFDTDQLQLRAFARTVVDPSLDTAALISRLAEEHQLYEVPATDARPSHRFELGARIGNRYFLIRIDPSRIPEDRYESLDVRLLHDLILGPVLGITDPRHDERLRFIPDLAQALQANTKADAWFLPHPPVLEDVMFIADSGRVMLAKSTWFAPKLPSGLAIRLVDPTTE